MAHDWPPIKHATAGQAVDYIRKRIAEERAGEEKAIEMLSRDGSNKVYFCEVAIRHAIAVAALEDVLSFISNPDSRQARQFQPGV